jgi:catechol 2,3-dioxygenase-like lactoylglutathione lyase family enzyme
MAAKTLPERPDLTWLKKTAKEQLARLRRKDPDAKLHQAQLKIARDYGFPSWRALKSHVDALSLDGQIITATVEGKTADLARLLAEHPAKLALTGGRWNTPLLHLAAEAGHLDCVKLLLKRGIDVNLRDRLDRATPLHWAASRGHLDVVKHLADAGADLDGEGDDHEIGVLGWATCFQHIQTKVADYLLARGAKPTIFSSVALDRADLIKQLILADRRLLHARMSAFEHRWTPLHLAVLKNQPASVAALLELGADIAQRDSRGRTPLACASPKTDPRIGKALTAAGADPSESSPLRFDYAVPILNVKNVPASIAYYVEKLGFEKEWDWGEPAVFGCVRHDGVQIFLCEGAQGSPGTWISIFVRDVDALHAEYERHGAIIRQKPTNFPWGLKEMNVEDLDGHRLRMGSEATGPSDGVDLAEDS